ncbi:MAG: hypothetical protein M3O41_12030 [Pseudomonadota bacterium]|nr:hypothetical protein [Pseudomonadota bacterium]
MRAPFDVLVLGAGAAGLAAGLETYEVEGSALSYGGQLYRRRGGRRTAAADKIIGASFCQAPS